MPYLTSSTSGGPPTAAFAAFTVLRAGEGGVLLLSLFSLTSLIELDGDALTKGVRVKDNNCYG
jgi:hypothetical protein